MRHALETLVKIVDENGGFTIIPQLHIPLLRRCLQNHIRHLHNPEPSREIALWCAATMCVSTNFYSLRQFEISQVSNYKMSITLLFDSNIKDRTVLPRCKVNKNNYKIGGTNNFIRLLVYFSA